MYFLQFFIYTNINFWPDYFFKFYQSEPDRFLKLIREEFLSGNLPIRPQYSLKWKHCYTYYLNIINNESLKTAGFTLCDNICVTFFQLHFIHILLYSTNTELSLILLHSAHSHIATKEFDVRTRIRRNDAVPVNCDIWNELRHCNLSSNHYFTTSLTLYYQHVCVCVWICTAC